MVDICQEGCSQRSAPQKRHMAHLRSRACCTPRKPSDWDGGGNKSQASTGGDCAWTWDGHKAQAQPSLRLCGVPENLNLSGLDLGSACNPGPPQTVPGRATWSLSSVDGESTQAVGRGTPSVAESLRAQPVMFVAVFLPPHSTTEQPSLKK